MITNPVLGGVGNQTGIVFFQKFIPAAITFALMVGVLIFFGMLIMGGIQWISSGGDKQALEGAKSKITNAVIGIVVLFATYAILSLIAYFFKITILTLDITPLIIQ